MKNTHNELSIFEIFIKMKFLIDNYTNNQTIIETKVKLNIVAYLPKVKNKVAKARREISPMSTIKKSVTLVVYSLQTQSTQHNPPQQHRSQLWAGKCQMVCKLMIIQIIIISHTPHNNNGFNFCQ